LLSHLMAKGPKQATQALISSTIQIGKTLLFSQPPPWLQPSPWLQPPPWLQPYPWLQPSPGLTSPNNTEALHYFDVGLACSNRHTLDFGRSDRISA
jgi:hypothetical protein